MPWSDFACDTVRMRRLVYSTIIAFGLVMVGSSSAYAEDPTPAPTVSAKATAGKKMCKIADPDLIELSGLAVLEKGYAVVNDGKEDNSGARVYFLNSSCKKVDEVSFPTDPKDPEDLVLSPDGKTLWIADIGNNGVRETPASPRATIALWSMPVDKSSKPKIHRLSYPDGDSHDAEALLFKPDGTPLIVTREFGKSAFIYQPTGPLKANSTAGVPMERVGELTLPATETPGNQLARVGNRIITGGAVNRGATKVVLRTYTDAFEWDVAGGDVVAALKKEPRTTGLPNEPFGEAIGYSTDGSLFYTVSDMSGDTEAANHIRQYTPATSVAAESKKSASQDSGSAWYLDPDNLAYAVGGVGLFGLILVGAGIFGIVRFRKSPQAAAVTAADRAPSGGIATGDPETELIGVGGAPQRGASYSGRPSGGGPVYGAKSGPGGGPQRGNGPAGGPQRGNGPVYGGQGGGPKGGGQQGGGQQGGGQQGGRPGGQQPPRGPQQPARGPQQPGQGPRNPQQPPRGPQQQPGRGGPQQPPARGPQPPARGGQQPARGGQQPARGGQQQPPPSRGPQQAPRSPQPPARGGQQPPARGPQQAPPRNPQQPPRGPQQQPGRGGQQGPPPGRGGGGGNYGGPQGGPPRGPQQGGGVYGGGPGGR